MNLAEILMQTEGKTLEFKRDLSSPEKVLCTIVAFANTAGGSLVIGVEDGTRSVRGLADPMNEEERLANLIADRIYPRLAPSLDVVAWRSAQLIVVEVFPSPLRPHFIKSQGAENGVYIRLGSTNRKADAAMIQELRRTVANESYDESPLLELDSEALDFRVASESFARRARFSKADAQTLRIVAPHGRRLVPTIGGILLFGKEPQAQFPDAWIQCGRFGGTDKTKLTDTVECRGRLFEALEEAFRFLQRHASQAIEIEGLKHKERSNIPLRAMRELLVNAVVHADYAQAGAPIRVSIFDDRIEVENPGILLAGLTIDDIRQGVSRLRNRVIGRVFKELGYIEQWGSGIQRATAECAASGLSAPEFEERGFRFRVTLRLQKIQAEPLDEVGGRIRDLFLEESGRAGLSTAQVAAAVGLTTRTVRTRLGTMIDQGVLVAVGKSMRDPKRRYFLRGGRAV